MSDLKPNQWYWIRKSNGQLVPHLFHRACPVSADGKCLGEFFVGSTLVRIPLSQVAGPAQMPTFERRQP